MLAATPNRFNWQFSTDAVPAATPGVSVVPGASNAEGSAVVLATAAQITEDVWGMLVIVNGGQTNTVSKMHLLDIGFDPAGGTSYAWKINDIACGSSIQTAGTGRVLWLPYGIPAGSQIACRVQGKDATAGTVRVLAIFYGRPTNPELAWCGQFCETIGTITNSNGPTFVPGVSGATGTWTSLGTTTLRLRYLYAGIQCDDATANTQVLLVDVGYSLDGGTTVTVVLEKIMVVCTGTTEAWHQPLNMNGYCDVPAGAGIYIRGSIDIATADSNYNATAVGIG